MNPFLTHILLIKVVNDSASETSCWWKQRKSGTMIAIDYHNSCETPTTSHLIPKRSFQTEEVKIFVSSKDFNPEDRRNITSCDKLRWIPPQTVAVATFEPVKVIKKRRRRWIRLQAIDKVKFKAGCADFKTNTRSIHSKCSFKVKLLKMEMSLRWTES